MSRSCGLEAYKGIKLNTPIRINFGKKVIIECPNSYAKWEYVGDAMEAWQYYKDGYLPEVYDKGIEKPLSILDQSEFFTVAHSLVESVKNKAEAQMMQKAQNKGKK